MSILYYTKTILSTFSIKKFIFTTINSFSEINKEEFVLFPKFLIFKALSLFFKKYYIAFSNLNASLLLISKFLSAYLSLKYRLIDPRLSAEYSSFASKTSERGYSLGYIAVHTRRNYIYI